MDVKKQGSSRFSLRTDLLVALYLAGGSLVIGIVPALVFDLPVRGVFVITVTALVCLSAVLGLLSLVVPTGNAVGDYLCRMVDENRPWGIGYIAEFAAGITLIASVMAFVVFVTSALALFWMVPTVLWLSVFRGVSISESVTYALMLTNGRPEYDGPGGLGTDPGTIVFFLFNVVAWLLIIAALCVLLSPIWFGWKWRERRRFEKWREDFESSRGRATEANDG
jgi:hypothetical protein